MRMLYTVGRVFLFGRKDAKEKLFINPVNDWSNLSCFVKRHLKSESPHYIYHGMAEDFLRVRNGVDESIDVKISESRKNDVIANKHVLLKIIEVLLLCGRQNIPIRGHLPERSNFVEILNFKASDDDILTEHLNSSKREKYTSPDIQNEIINIMGDQIRQTIVDKCNSSRCFALIADETTDKSVKEQRWEAEQNCAHYVKLGGQEELILFTRLRLRSQLSVMHWSKDDGDQKAKQYLSAIMKFDFIISLVIAEHIMKSTVYLPVFLQGKECDLVEAMKECKVVVDVLRQERADESVWDELYQSAVDIGQPLNIQESMPRRVGRQCHRDNHPVDTPKQYWRVATYLPFIDHMKQELESRLLSPEDRFNGQYLLPRVVNNITQEQIVAIYETYKDDMNVSLDVFKAEILRWKMNSK
ncbi:LOW QUALITY PROTEIN: hypothetical protein KUTeg_006977 [Tegillarca granosa]|uniref:DUF4371 domain-containing protein n=1 Tax=Tegillarca granosa TaxID=220873 RepID=A0ABQ9FBX0_TEGGR|nr:LOW QUALITY PROTEIN: hypothetical protein KUTeg_006977 [Tegillarca granosa]